MFHNKLIQDLTCLGPKAILEFLTNNEKTQGDTMETSDILSYSSTQKTKLCVVLDMNGILFKQCYQPSPTHSSILYGRNKYLVL